jgi:hypothetical protein
VRVVPASLCLALCFAGHAAAQQITRVIPDAAAPGDLVILEGTSLEDTISVDFTAQVGGFVGTWTAGATPITVSPTRVTVLLPGSFGFAPPGASPPGVPLGRVRARTPAGLTGPLPFFFMQGTFMGFESPQTTTLGTGTTQSTGGKPVVSFDIQQGAPQPGNAGFVMECQNAVPSSTAVLLVGLPDSPPFPMIGDGTFVLDLAGPIVVAVPVPTDALGEASLALPIPGPGPFGVTLANQWAVLDGAGVAVSNGLVYIL